jgi:hypothetical protein
MEDPRLPGAGTMFGGALTCSMSTKRTAIKAAMMAARGISFILKVKNWNDINRRPAYYDPYQTIFRPTGVEIGRRPTRTRRVWRFRNRTSKLKNIGGGGRKV